MRSNVRRDLSFKDVKVYKPGWLGYAGTLSAPAENEDFVNIGAMNHHIGSLQNRVAELEKELADGNMKNLPSSPFRDA
jgi:thiosulfate/3-mercaptopyruvate sulfurtransferase